MAKPTKEQVIRVRRVLATAIGTERAETAKVKKLVVVERVTLREVVDERELVRPGREARVGELWTGTPRWMRTHLSGVQLAPAPDPVSDYRSDGRMDTLSPASRRRARHWLDALRADAGSEPAVRLEVSHELVAVVRVSRSEGALVGLTSTRVLAWFPVGGALDGVRTPSAAWVALMVVLWLAVPGALGAHFEFGELPAISTGAAIVLASYAVWVAWAAVKDRRFR